MKDIFIVELVDGDIVACYKETIEESIKNYEEDNVDIDWETIAKVKGVFANMDVSVKHIEWYKGTPDEQTQNKALFSIIQLIKMGRPRKNQETPNTEKDSKELLQTIDKLEKDFGKGVVMRLGEKITENVKTVPTSSLGLDLALGIGGLPYGRVVEIYGPESSGKTTLASHIIANVQKQGGRALLIDAEHAFDKDYAKNLGVDIDNLWINQPDYAEQALEVADRFIDSNSVDIVVIDSVAALVPKAELEGEMGDSRMGVMARLMSQALRKLTGKISKTGTLVIFINQIRDKIGVMFGNPETTTGGNALKFYASVRLDIRKIAVLKDGDEATGNRVKIKVVKNKLAPPFKQVELDIEFGYGFDSISEVIEIGTDLEIINKSGSWYSYQQDKIGQGKEQVKNLLKDNEDLFEEIKNKIVSKLKSH